MNSLPEAVTLACNIISPPVIVFPKEQDILQSVSVINAGVRSLRMTYKPMIFQLFTTSGLQSLVGIKIS